MWWRGAIAGVLAGGAALGVGQFVAGFTGASSSPVVAVGQLQIDFTPPWLKNFAISNFGSHDKEVLVGGILVVLALFAGCVGALAMRRLVYGMAGIAIFAAVGLTAAASRPTATFETMLPTLSAVLVAVVVLRLLISLAWADLSKEADADAGARVDAGRRGFLIAGTGVAVTAAVADLVGRGLTERKSVTAVRNALRIPAAAEPVAALSPATSLNVPGLTPFVTSNSRFYRVDTAIVVPQVDPKSWTLHIHGMVNKELTITFDELIRHPLIEDYITLCCVSNPVAGPYISNAKWLGVSLAGVLREAGIKAGADQLFCTSVDGFTSGTPVQTVMDGRDALLAVSMNGEALPVEHGLPVRMVVPGLYGYVSATNWVT